MEELCWAVGNELAAGLVARLGQGREEGAENGPCDQQKARI